MIGFISILGCGGVLRLYEQVGYNMRSEKTIILTIGIVIGALVTFARLSLMGWLFLFGIISAVIFGTIHFIFLYQLDNRFENLNAAGKKIAWIGIITYPMIFLFQFDFGDSAGTFYTYEYLTGENDSNFELYAFYIAIVSAIIYLINFVLWLIKTKSSIANNV